MHLSGQRLLYSYELVYDKKSLANAQNFVPLRASPPSEGVPGMWQRYKMIEMSLLWSGASDDYGSLRRTYQRWFASTISSLSRKIQEKIRLPSGKARSYGMSPDVDTSSANIFA